MKMNTNLGYRLWTVQGPDRTLFITAVFDGSARELEVIEKCYRDIGHILAINDMRIVQERIFGRLSENATITVVRNAGLTPINPAISPPVFIEGVPVHGGPCAGVLIRAVPKTAASAIEIDHHVVGTTWRFGESQWVILPGVAMRPLAKISDLAAETESLLQKCEQVLAAIGFTFQEVFRTWFYLDDILSWYDQFNIGRTKKYTAWEMVPTEKTPDIKLPASTGIGVRNGVGGAGVLALLAQRGAASIEQMRNPGQKDAFKYGSAFSRGALLTFSKGKILELSGTAAIDETGATVYLGDSAKQIECTLDKIKTLISTRGFNISDLAGGAAFLKDRGAFPVLDNALENLGLKNLPLIPMQADVCRDDLLFEIDGEFVQNLV